MRSLDVAIVGAGLAGLAAGLKLGRAGLRCEIFERSSMVGGRAKSDRDHGYAINVGPHALYRKRAAERALIELGVPLGANRVSASGSYLLEGGELKALPGGFVSLMVTDVLDLPAKIELARVMAGLRFVDPKSWSGRSGEEWLSTISSERARRVVRTIMRIATYSARLDRIDAQVALDQLASAVFDGVSYLDGGWQSLIEALVDRIEQTGVTIHRETKIESLWKEGGRVRGLRTHVEPIEASAVLLAAGGPDRAAKLSGSPTLERFSACTHPIEAAVLDVALDRRINPAVKFVAGLDRPLYFSVHSDSAHVAPRGGSLVSAMIYLDDEQDSKLHEHELEALLDRIQPEWRAHVVTRRFLPRLTVAHAQVEPSQGLSARPSTIVPDVPGLYLAGDWVGAEGMLADATLASALAAARAIESAIEVHSERRADVVREPACQEV